MNFDFTFSRRKPQPPRVASMLAVFAALLFAACRAGAAESPFTVVGWQLQSGDETQINKMIYLAAQHGVNHLQLSHDIIMDIDELANDTEKAAMIRRVAQRAKEKGIGVYVWSHEFNTNEMTVCLDPEIKSGKAFWEKRQEVYRKALSNAPELAGVIVSFGSSHPDPWALFCTCGWCKKHDNADRVALILDKVGAVVEKEFGMTLYARTFIHAPKEMEWVGDALRRTAPRPGLKMMPKDVPQDWEPYYPHDPLIGNAGGHPTMIEVDLAGEYWGRSKFPFDLTDYLQYRMRYARSKGAEGYVGRIERGSDSLFSTTNELNLYAYHALLADPDRDADDIRLEWIAKRYGLKPDSPDAAKLMHVYKTSFDAVRKMYYELGFWALEKGSDLTDTASTPQLLTARSIALWDEAFKPREKSLVAPDEETYRRIIAEKAEAVALADSMLAELKKIKGLSAADRKALETDLTQFSRATRVFELANGALWGNQLYKQTNKPEHKEWALDFAAALGEYGKILPADQWPGGSKQVGKFLANFSQALPGNPETAAADYPIVKTIVLPENVETTKSEIRVSFDTGSPLSCRLNGGTHLMKLEPWGDWEPEKKTSHVLIREGLQPAERYIFTVSCKNIAGSEATLYETSDYLATTKP